MDVVRRLSRVDRLFFSACLSPSSYDNQNGRVPKKSLKAYCDKALSLFESESNETKDTGGVPIGKKDMTREGRSPQEGGGNDKEEAKGKGKGKDLQDTIHSPTQREKSPATLSERLVPAKDSPHRRFFIPLLRLCSAIRLRECSGGSWQLGPPDPRFLPVRRYLSSPSSSSPYLKHIEWDIDMDLCGLSSEVVTNHSDSHWPLPSFPNLRSINIEFHFRSFISDLFLDELRSLLHPNFAPRLERLSLTGCGGPDFFFPIMRNLVTPSIREIQIEGGGLSGKFLLDLALHLESLPSIAL